MLIGFHCYLGKKESKHRQKANDSHSTCCQTLCCTGFCTFRQTIFATKLFYTLSKVQGAPRVPVIIWPQKATQTFPVKGNFSFGVLVVLSSR